MANRGQPVGSDADLNTDAAIQSETVGEQAARGISIQQTNCETQDGAERETCPDSLQVQRNFQFPKVSREAEFEKNKKNKRGSAPVFLRKYSC